MDFLNDTSETSIKCVINDLPDEVLGYILGLLRPYKDLKECMLVCKRWNRIALGVFQYKNASFNRCLVNFNVQWEHFTPTGKSHTISKRYSHSACGYGNSMYVFGGCTCTSTTFNDLWRLDLSSRTWHRLLTMGSYPTPKALATLVHYKGVLALFGGWTHTTPLLLHQAWRTFNELHMYDIIDNRWSCVVTPTLSPPPIAGHSATVHRDDMVVFGGICGQYVNGSVNDIWCYNFLTQSWRIQQTTDPKPASRYNQSQIKLDDDHLLIIGGCRKPNSLMNDVWLLTMQENVWQWREVTVQNSQWGASHHSNSQWCHPLCKSGTNVITIGRVPNSTVSSFSRLKWTLAPAQIADDILYRRAQEGCASPVVDRDVNVNGKRGVLTPRQGNADHFLPPSPIAGAPANNRAPNVNVEAVQVNETRPSSGEKIRNQTPYRNINLPINNNMAAFRTTSTNFGSKQRERQLEVLNRMEERLRNRCPKPQSAKENPKKSLSSTRLSMPKMAMFVMDIANVLTDLSVNWLPIKKVAPGGPEHTILYSLVPGQGEIIMFGGMEKEISCFRIDEPLNITDTVTNTLHFITAPQQII